MFQSPESTSKYNLQRLYFKWPGDFYENGIGNADVIADLPSVNLLIVKA